METVIAIYRPPTFRIAMPVSMLSSISNDKNGLFLASIIRKLRNVISLLLIVYSLFYYPASSEVLIFWNELV